MFQKDGPNQLPSEDDSKVSLFRTKWFPKQAYIVLQVIRLAAAMLIFFIVCIILLVVYLVCRLVHPSHMKHENH